MNPVSAVGLPTACATVCLGTMYTVKISVTLHQRGTCVATLFQNVLQHTCIKGAKKFECCFSQISFDWFIRRMTEV